MKSKEGFYEQIDRFLSGELTAEELEAFKIKLQQDINLQVLVDRYKRNLLIEKYLQKELTTQEATEFELLKKSDPLFSKELLFQQSVSTQLKNTTKMEAAKLTINQIRLERTSISKRNKYLLLALISLTFLVFLIYQLSNTKNPENFKNDIPNVVVPLADSTSEDNDPALRDTVSTIKRDIAKTEPPITKEKPSQETFLTDTREGSNPILDKEEKNKIIIDLKAKGKVLFANYFQVPAFDESVLSYFTESELAKDAADISPDKMPLDATKIDCKGIIVANETIEGKTQILRTKSQELIVRGNYIYSIELINDERGIVAKVYSYSGVQFNKGDELIFMDESNNRYSFPFIEKSENTIKEGTLVHYNILNLNARAIDWLSTNAIKTTYIKNNINNEMRKFTINESRRIQFKQLAFCFNLNLEKIASIETPNDNNNRTNATSSRSFFNAVEKYNNKDFKEALVLLEEFEGSKPMESEKEAALFFYKGICYLSDMVNQPENAVNALKKIAETGDKIFVEQANWYLALSWLKSGNMQEGKLVLEEIIKSPNHEKLEEAKLLLTDIGH